MGYLRCYNIEKGNDRNYKEDIQHMKIHPRYKLQTLFTRHHVVIPAGDQHHSRTDKRNYINQENSFTNIFTCNSQTQTEEPYAHIRVVATNETIFLHDTNLQNTLFHTETATGFERLRTELIRTRNNDKTITKYNKSDENHTGTNITKVLLFIQFMYQTIHRLLKSQQIGEIILKGKLYILRIDLAQLKAYFNTEINNTTSFQYDRPLLMNKIDKLEITDAPNRLSVVSKDTHSTFNISIERQSIRFNITVCKYETLSEKFISYLSSLYSLIFNNYKFQNAPSFYARYWHFRNISQGYLLGILLRNANICTLNTMRNFYYIVITSPTANLNIEINFKLKNGIFMVYDNNQLRGFSQESVIWNRIHEQTLKNSSANISSHVIRRLKDLSQEEATDCKETLTRDSNISSSSSSLNSVNEETVLNNSLFHTDFLHSKDTFHTAMTEDKNEPFILAKGNPSRYNEADKFQRDGGDTLYSKIFKENQNIYITNFMHSKKWLSKLFKESKDKIYSYRNFEAYDIVNETMFETCSITDRLYKMTNDFSKQVTSHTFYKVFMKTLGASMMNIMYSVVL